MVYSGGDTGTAVAAIVGRLTGCGTKENTIQTLAIVCAPAGYDANQRNHLSSIHSIPRRYHVRLLALRFACAC